MRNEGSVCKENAADALIGKRDKTQSADPTALTAYEELRR